MIEQAIWAGDVSVLHEIAPCRCCCSEHTFENCPARAWFGCRASFADAEAIESSERSSWERVYAACGMSLEEFYGLPTVH